MSLVPSLPHNDNGVWIVLCAETVHEMVGAYWDFGLYVMLHLRR